MTSWVNDADDDKGCWHWMGVASTMALDLGLHQSAMTASFSAKNFRQRRRLWWSIYIRDRMFVQALSRPSRIRPEETDTPMLNCEDFDFIVDSSGLSKEGSKYVPGCDTENQQQLAEFCVKLAELSVHIGEVIPLHFSMIPSTPRIRSSNATDPPLTPMLYLRSNLRDEAVWSLDQKLQSWFLTLPPSCVYKPSELCGEDSASIRLCRGYLRVAYFSLLSALHRPQCFTTPSNSHIIQGQILSRDRVRHAANEVTFVTRDLNRIGLLARGPPAGFGMFQLSAVHSHVEQLESADSDVRTKIIQQLLCTIQAVEALQEVYQGADFAASLLGQLLSRAEIYVLKDKNKDLSGICFKGKLYTLDKMPAVMSVSSRLDTVDQHSERPARCESPQFCELASQNGPILPDLGWNDWDLSFLNAMSYSLSPFLIDCGNTGGEDLWFTEDSAASFDFNMGFDPF